MDEDNLILKSIRIFKENILTYLIASAGIGFIVILIIPFIAFQILISIAEDMYGLEIIVNNISMIFTLSFISITIFGITNDIIEMETSHAERFVYYLKKYWGYAIILGIIGTVIIFISRYIENVLYYSLTYEHVTKIIIVKSIQYTFLSISLMYIVFIFPKMVLGTDFIQSIKFSLTYCTRNILKTLPPAVLLIFDAVITSRIVLDLAINPILYFLVIGIGYAFAIILMIIITQISIGIDLETPKSKYKSTDSEDSSIQLLGGI